MTRGPTRALLVVVALLLLARVGWAAWAPRSDPAAVRSPDTPSYLAPARSLLQDGRFDELGSDGPMFVRTPGYPLFLAGALWLTDDERLVGPLQAVLSGLAVVAVWLVASRILGGVVGAVAALLVALDPLQFVAAGTLLSEGAASVAMAAVAAAGAAVFLPAPGRVRPWAPALLGGALAAATLVRPTTYYLPLVVVVLLVLRLRPLGARRTALLAGCFLVPLVVFVGGWQVRNARVVDSVRLSGIEAINLSCYRAAGAEAIDRGVDTAVVRAEYGCGCLDVGPGGSRPAPWWRCPRDRSGPVGPFYDDMADEALATLADHPAAVVEMTGRALVRVALGPGTETVARYLSVGSSPILSVPLAAWTIGLWGAAAAGVVLGRRRPEAAYLLFLATVVAYTVLVSAGPEGYARMRTPVVPLIVLLATPAVASALARRSPRERRRRRSGAGPRRW